MADDLAAEDVEHHIPVIVLALHGGRQPRDIPTPHLSRAGGAMAGDNAVGGLLCPSPVVLLRRRLQHTVKARLRCDEHAPVRQRRHDLTWWQAGEFLAVGDGQYPRALVLAQLVGWRRPRAG